jgi:hypothetical protein
MNIDIKTTFAAKKTTLEVVCRSMKKKGIAVFLRSKTGKAKADLGCRNIFAAEEIDEAKAAYAELVEQTTAKGWPLKGEHTKVKSAGTFSEIPAPPSDEAEGDEQEAEGEGDEPEGDEPAEEPEPEPKANGKGKGKGKGK